jgi:PKD repeat protein
MKKLIIGLALIIVLAGAAACSSAQPSWQTGASVPSTTYATMTQTAPSKEGFYGVPTPTVTVPPMTTTTMVSINHGAGYDTAADNSPDIQRMVIRTGQLTLVVEDVGGAISSITNLASTFNGFVVSSNSWQDRDRMVGNISIRVEAQHFDEAIAALHNMAVDVTSESTSGQDVTEEYIDLNAQLTNLQASEAQLLELMKQAGDVDQILEVQKELTNTRGQIEQIKGRMQYLEQSTAMSLIQINLEQSKLSVDFTAETRNVKVGQDIHFYPTISGGFSPYSYAWEFGDGDTSTEEQPVHAYQSAGVYKVTLTVTDDRGNTDSYERDDYINVTVAPGWSAGNIATGAWHGLVSFGHVLLSIVIWIGIFSPLWIAILVILYFTLWRKKKTA